MKNKKTDYTIEAILLVFAMALAPDLLLSHCNNPKIIKKATDGRGLTSIVYIDKNNGNDTFALDYLNKHELDSVINAIK